MYPIGLLSATTGVDPSTAWNKVERLLKSYHTPARPPAAAPPWKMSKIAEASTGSSAMLIPARQMFGATRLICGGWTQEKVDTASVRQSAIVKVSAPSAQSLAKKSSRIDTCADESANCAL